jgi:uncharacterized protein YlxW (UPF0749 family)
MSEQTPAANINTVLDLVLADYAQVVKQAAISRAAWLEQVAENTVLRQQRTSLQDELTECQCRLAEEGVPDAG